jgi:hypothetical protein
MIARTVTPLTYFLRSDRGGGPHADTDRNTWVSLTFIIPPMAGWRRRFRRRGPSKMTISRPKSPLPDNPEFSSLASRSAVRVKLPAARFVTFRLKGFHKTMKNISQFCIQKALDNIAGKVTNASRLKNGTPLAMVRNEKQAEVLLTATLLGSHPVHVGRHTWLNSSRGVIHTDSLDGMSDEEIQSTLADQFVSRTGRLSECFAVSQRSLSRPPYRCWDPAPSIQTAHLETLCGVLLGTWTLRPAWQRGRRCGSCAGAAHFRSSCLHSRLLLPSSRYFILVASRVGQRCWQQTAYGETIFVGVAILQSHPEGRRHTHVPPDRSHASRTFTCY